MPISKNSAPAWLRADLKRRARKHLDACIPHLAVLNASRDPATMRLAAHWRQLLGDAHRELRSLP